MEHPLLEYLSCIRSADRAALLKNLSDWGFTTVIFNGEKVHNAQELFQQVGLQLGLQEAMKPKSWDSFRDALFEVMTQSQKAEIALIWDSSDQMLAGDLQDFLQAMNILESVAISTRRAREIDSYTFLLGASDAYRPLSTLTATHK